MKTMKIFRKLSLGFACRLVMLTVLLLAGEAVRKPIRIVNSLFG